MDFDREAFITGYVECALWADCYPTPDEQEVEPNWESGGRQHLELRPGARDKLVEDCNDFITHNLEDLLTYIEQMTHWRPGEGPPEAWAGHDFWLTRSGHGVGFWDRGLGGVGERLTEAAKVYGSPDAQTPYDCGDGTADVW